MSISTKPEEPLISPETTEPELIRRAQWGDSTAFDSLYGAHAGRVFAVLLRLCSDRETAERLTQDTFVLAWRRLDTFHGSSRLTSWLHRIAVNVMLQDVRAAGRRASRVVTVADELLHRPRLPAPRAPTCDSTWSAPSRHSPSARERRSYCMTSRGTPMTRSLP